MVFRKNIIYVLQLFSDNGSIQKMISKPSFKIGYKNLFVDNYIGWATIYMLPRLVAYNSYMLLFQKKILNNVLILNIFGVKPSPLYSIYKSFNIFNISTFNTTKCHFGDSWFASNDINYILLIFSYTFINPEISNS